MCNNKKQYILDSSMQNKQNNYYLTIMNDILTKCTECGHLQRHQHHYRYIPQTDKGDGGI